MPQSNSSTMILVLCSLFLGLLMATYPLSAAFSVLRPELICLLVIYWVTNASLRYGVWFAWMVGLVQDIVEGVTWGAHALALAIVAYICVMAYQRIKNYSVWHQTLWVFVLVGFHQVIVNWVQSLAGYKSTPSELILSTITSALFWPLIYFCLFKIRFAYRYH